jgi:hypothetical protein
MCKTCPFNPDSPLFHHGPKWAADLKKAGYFGPHGCHNLEDKVEPQPENVCVGHELYLEFEREAKIVQEHCLGIVH